MKDLTAQEQQLLLGKIKSFLNITWDDIDTDTQILDMIKTSTRRIDEIAGVELDYVTDSEDSDPLFFTASCLGQELLKQRIFYQREKGLDDFEKNYRGEITSLYLYGKVLKGRINADQ